MVQKTETKEKDGCEYQTSIILEGEEEVRTHESERCRVGCTLKVLLLQEHMGLCMPKSNKRLTQAHLRIAGLWNF